MILQALTEYYETLAAQGRISRPGWAKVKVSWGLEIGENGGLIDVLPLRHLSEDGKKMLPREMELPATVTAAPMTGSPLVSTTLPLMVRFWA